MTLAYEDFAKIEIRAGTVVSAEPAPRARKPAYRLEVDFGPGIGRRRSSAQITDLYTPEALIGRQVMAVVNLPPRQIGRFLSEVLVLGVSDAEGRVVLIRPDRPVPDGAAMF